MASKAFKKLVSGQERTHARLQIDVPVDILPLYRKWCVLNDTDMTADINAFIESRIAGFHPPKMPAQPPAKSRPRHK